MANFSIPGCDKWMRIIGAVHYGGADALGEVWRNNTITGLNFIYDDSVAAQQQLHRVLDQRNHRGRRIVSVMKNMEPLVFTTNQQTDI